MNSCVDHLKMFVFSSLLLMMSLSLRKWAVIMWLDQLYRKISAASAGEMEPSARLTSLTSPLVEKKKVLYVSTAHM